MKLVRLTRIPVLWTRSSRRCPVRAGDAAAPTFMRNLLTSVPKSPQSFVATMLRTIFAQPDALTVREQHQRIVGQLEERFPDATAMLDEAGPELLAFTGCPKEHWRDLWGNNSLEPLTKKIRRRTDAVGIFPDRAPIVRLVGPVLAEQYDESQVARCYMSAESITKALADRSTNPRR